MLKQNHLIQNHDQYHQKLINSLMQKDITGGADQPIM